MPGRHARFADAELPDDRHVAAATIDHFLDVIEFLRLHLEASAESVGLNMIQAMALKALGEPVSQRELSEALACDASYVTGIVDRLEEVGAVERRTSPDDRRVKLLHRTDNGETLNRELDEKLFGQLTPIERGLTANQVRTLHDLLVKVVAAHAQDGTIG